MRTVHSCFVSFPLLQQRLFEPSSHTTLVAGWPSENVNNNEWCTAAYQLSTCGKEGRNGISMQPFPPLETSDEFFFVRPVSAIQTFYDRYLIQETYKPVSHRTVHCSLVVTFLYDHCEQSTCRNSLTIPSNPTCGRNIRTSRQRNLISPLFSCLPHPPSINYLLRG